MNFERLVEISRALKDEKQTGRAFHTTFALRKNRIVNIGFNDYNKTHPLTINYKNRFGNSYNYVSGIHSESCVVSRLKMDDLSEFTFVNIRIMNDGNLGMSAPCSNCHQLLLKYGVCKLFYSNTLGGFSKLIF